MGVKRVWSTAGVAALTGALLLTSAPVASADYIRDKQWTLDAFDVDSVWAESRGQGVTVAVVDSGVSGKHPDLSGQLVRGIDVSDGGSNPQLDANGHGTRMASLIAGRGHGSGNSAGVMGLAPSAKIMPIRIARNGEGELNDRTWAKGVRYAVDHGAKVINMALADPNASLGSDGADAIAYAQKHDVVVVASAGNDGASGLEYPAKLPGVVAVGAIDESQELWEDSNYGSGMTLIAPGENIVAADPTIPSGYSKGSGTSDSTAFVSATAALIRSKYPDLSAGQVINRLIKSTTFLNHKVDKVPDEKFGYGMIRPNKALRMDIPAGPKAGPLPQAPTDAASKSENEPSINPDSSPKADEGGMLRPSTILMIVGIVLLVGVVGVIFLIVRNRNNRGSSGGPGPGGPGAGVSGSGFAQGPYSNTPPGAHPTNPRNAYQQQPPNGGN